MPTDTPDLKYRPIMDILAQIQAGGDGREEVEVPEFGAKFRIKGLSRSEVLHISKSATDPRTGQLDQAKADWLTIQAAVEQPRISEADYDRLRRDARANKLINILQTKLGELTSGTKTDAAGDQEDAVDAAEARFPGAQ
ncbi:MAG: hypothetical protein AVDCRST_MAG77-1843 [uncultured Chloroflexi bacterium]|uniref:Uncharacterized protein n=1 Tax=uncultured Chloroflexota bacterium TaxID=166587 RepID=A0A6J4IBY7_9CHLR|nr:MAG: hypothetical protein AVDCRST_MAG77-1843 [uncultured Chloroflexota bacterium]